MPQPQKDPLTKASTGMDRPVDWEQRLVRLDEIHYFDPVVQAVLVVGADGTGFATPGQSSGRAAEMAGEDARREGYKPVQGGLFWNAGERRLYVKESDHYVLFALDRRTDADPS
jgi:hypothetical protein